MSIWGNTLGTLFNEYASHFGKRTTECDRDFDIDCGKIRIRLFGSNERKQAAWKKEHPDARGEIYFVTVSTNPVEIWGDVRQLKDGSLVVNHTSLGHEINHAMRVIMSGWTLTSENEGELLSPDKYKDI